MALRGGGDADSEFDIQLARRIHRLAIDEDALAVQLDAAPSRSMDLAQMAPAFHVNLARGEARAHRRNCSGCDALQRYRRAVGGLHAPSPVRTMSRPHAGIEPHSEAASA